MIVCSRCDMFFFAAGGDDEEGQNTRKKTRGEKGLSFNGEIKRQKQDSQEQLRNLGMPDRAKNSRKKIKQSVKVFEAGFMYMYMQAKVWCLYVPSEGLQRRIAPG